VGSNLDSICAAGQSSQAPQQQKNQKKVKRHGARLYYGLNEEIREHYKSKGDWIYAGLKRRNVQHEDHKCHNHERLAWNMPQLIKRLKTAKILL
jgi:hypothetical protein